MRLQIRAKRDKDGSVGLFIFDAAGETRAALPVTFGEPSRTGEEIGPTLVLSEEAIALLLADLCGGDVGGVVNAQAAHIADLMETVRCLLPSRPTS